MAKVKWWGMNHKGLVAREEQFDHTDGLIAVAEGKKMIGTAIELVSDNAPQIKAKPSKRRFDIIIKGTFRGTRLVRNVKLVERAERRDLKNHPGVLIGKIGPFENILVFENESGRKIYVISCCVARYNAKLVGKKRRANAKSGSGGNIAK
ncbi:MAG: hypothetical protein WC242_01655 [Candidatus Paceibacterota bacterium]|jgi:hypothetical protein